MCGLRVGDVTFSGPGQLGLVLVRQGKGKKDRVVALNSVVERALRAYLATRDGLAPRSPLFVRGGTRQALNSAGPGKPAGAPVQPLWHRWGFGPYPAPHLCHPQPAQGGEPLGGEEVLGHSSLISTERYLHLLRETMCAELEQHAL